MARGGEPAVAGRNVRYVVDRVSDGMIHLVSCPDLLRIISCVVGARLSDSVLGLDARSLACCSIHGMS